MLVSDNLGVNEKGNLTIGGMDTVELANDFGTPLYVMDEEKIVESCRKFKSSMDKFYNGNGMVCYASKAFCCKEMCRIMAKEGMGLDVVSEGELFTAISAGFPTDKLCFHGNNKTDSELTLALSYGVGRIVVDNLEELKRLSELAGKLHKKANIMLRIKPGIDAHTHSFIMTGQIDSKFGFALETGEAFEAVKLSCESENVTLKGLHCHIGSQIFELEPFCAAAEVMLKFIAKIKNELGFEIDDLDLGGGFGIKYVEDNKPLPYEVYMEKVSERVKSCCDELKVKMPYIIIEPGRSIAAPAGITLYKIGSVKEIPGVRNYVSVDGGMCDNPRYILYQSEYDFEIANKASKAKDYKCTVAGKCCESGDLLGKDIMLQNPQAGDTLAVLATGAYNYSMASNYNRISRPPVVMISGGKARVIVKRESLEDLIKNDV